MALVVSTIVALTTACSDDASSTGSDTTAPRVTETLPATPAIRVVERDDLRTALATDVLIAALTAHGAVVVRVRDRGDATATLHDGDADLAVVAAPRSALDVLGSRDGVIAFDPFPGGTAEAELVPVLSASASARFGDLLDAVVTGATAATDGAALDAMTDRVAAAGDPIDEVVADHLVQRGIVDATRPTTAR